MRALDLPAISVEWDGTTPLATLKIDECEIHGEPSDVQRMFFEINKLRNRCATAEAGRQYLINGALDLLRRVE